MSEGITSILGSVGKFIGNLLFSGLLSYIEKRKLSPISCVVLPSSSGKSKLLEAFKTEFGNLSTDLYLLDIEDAVNKDPKNAGVIKQLEELKKTDILIYQSKLFTLCKENLEELRTHLKNTKVKKHIIVFVSSNELKKYLEIKKALYYAPAKKLFNQLLSKNAVNADYMSYTRQLLDAKDTFIFSNFEELYNKFLEDLKIERTIN
jgi:hypothetical protein